MELYPKDRVHIADVKKFIIVFYIVGILGFLVPYTRPLFVLITPIALIVNTYLLLLYHHSYTKKTILLFGAIMLLGYLVEVVGVNTGFIFGSYKYGNALGVKIFNTPLLIGLNWLFLTYTSYSIVNKLPVKEWVKQPMAPLLMLIYDVFLEHVAPDTDMWYWTQSEVPIRNFIAWYIIGLIFTTLFKIGKVDTTNDLAPILFVTQLLFFITLSIAI